MSAALRLPAVLAAFLLIIAAGASVLVTSTSQTPSTPPPTPSTTTAASPTPAPPAATALPKMKLASTAAQFELAGIGFLSGARTLSVYVKSRERIMAAQVDLAGPLKTQRLFEAGKCTRVTRKERDSAQQLTFPMPTTAPPGTYEVTLRVRTSDCTRKTVRPGKLAISFTAAPPAPAAP